MSRAVRSVHHADPDKREAILDAALEVFAESGVHGTPVPPIAEAAGVGVGTLYRYFDGKEALVNAVFRQAKDDLQACLLENLELGEPSKALFDTIWARLTHFARTRPAAFRFLEVQDHHGYLDEDSRATEMALLEPLMAMVETGQQAGLLSARMRPETGIALFWGAFVGLFKAERLGYITLDETDIEAARDSCWAAITNRS